MEDAFPFGGPAYLLQGYVTFREGKLIKTPIKASNNPLLQMFNWGSATAAAPQTIQIHLWGPIGLDWLAKYLATKSVDMCQLIGGY